MTDWIGQDLEAFAREELGRPIFGRLELKPESRIDEDLRLTGLDAVEFIDKFELLPWFEEPLTKVRYCVKHGH